MEAFSKNFSDLNFIIDKKDKNDKFKRYEYVHTYVRMYIIF